jgi:uncharacterized membrane protein
MDDTQTNRFWELDFTRGLAVVMMIIYHLLYDLNYFGGYSIDVRHGFWLFFAKATAAIFITLVGISLQLSSSKARMQGISNPFPIFFRRGLKIFALGLLITLVTYLLMGNGFIIFGILHFIGISIIVAYPFLNRRIFNLFLGLVFIMMGEYLNRYSFDIPGMFWLGFVPNDFYSVDFVPMIPWFGLVLIGLYLGSNLYSRGRRNFKLFDLSNFWFVKSFTLLGKNSLAIYLVHQPIIIAFLVLMGIIQLSRLG